MSKSGRNYKPDLGQMTKQLDGDQTEVKDELDGKWASNRNFFLLVDASFNVHPNAKDTVGGYKVQNVHICYSTQRGHECTSRCYRTQKCINHVVMAGIIISYQKRKTVACLPSRQNPKVLSGQSHQTLL